MTDYEAAPEDLVTAFVEAFNAGDFDAVDELLADEVDVHGIVEEADTPVGVLEELWIRSPWMSMARAEVGLDPVAAVWIPDEHGRYRPVGFFEFETSGESIVRLELFETVPDDLLSEEPPAAWVATEVQVTDEDSSSALPETDLDELLPEPVTPPPLNDV